eukprot:240397_1
MQCVKLVVMGDSFVGKTSVIVSYNEDGLPNRHLPQVYDNVSKNILLSNNRPVQLGIWDVSSHAEYDRLRPLSYPRTDVFLLMYDVSNNQSLQNLETKWFPEKKHHVPESAFGVVGCKIDLREQEAMCPLNDELNEIRLCCVICYWLRNCNVDELRVDKSVLEMIVTYSQCTKSRKDYVRYEDGEDMARKLGACGYKECSAITKEGLEELFEAACEWVLGGDEAKKIFQKQYDEKHKNKKGCIIM